MTQSSSRARASRKEAPWRPFSFCFRASKGTPPFLAGLSYYGRHLDDVASPLHGEGDFQGKLPHIRLDFA